MNKSLYCYGSTLNGIRYIDTERVAQYLLPDLPKTELGHYTRENICKFLSIDIQKSHDALSDAIDCLKMFCQFVENYTFKLDSFILEYSFSTPAKRITLEDYDTKFISKSHLTREEIAVATVNAECDEDFIGKTVVLTGDFSKFPIIKKQN